MTVCLFEDICLSSRCTDSGSDLLRSTFIHGIRPGSWNEVGASSLFIVVCSSVFKVAFHWFWFRVFLFGSVTNYAVKATWVPCCLVVEALCWEEPSHWILPPIC